MNKFKLLFVLVLLSTANLTAQEINWISIEDAVKKQKKNPKKIMMDVYTLWCGPCKMLDKNTFQNPDVAKYVNEYFYAVKFNAEGGEEVKYKDRVFKNPGYDASLTGRNSSHEFAAALQISAYPTIVFFDEEANTIMPLTGYQSPNQLEIYLKLFESDEHKNISTQEEWSKYQKEFKSEFKS